LKLVLLEREKKLRVVVLENFSRGENKSKDIRGILSSSGKGRGKREGFGGGGNKLESRDER